jgi:hypothetical protein
MKRILPIAVAVLALLATFLGVAPAQAASPPGGLRAENVSSTSFLARWNPVSRATLYQVTLNGAYAGSSTTTSRKLDGLRACTSYKLQVKVKVGRSWSGLSSPVAVKTAGCVVTPPEPTPAPSPTLPPSPGSAAEAFGWGSPVAAGSDEFNGTAVDATKWNNYDGIAGHAGNGRRMAAQSVVAGGVLTQTGLPNGDTGYLSSKYRPGTMYGKWEVRMRTSARVPQYHPVNLLWPDTGGDRTTDDEVDFAEGTNDTSSRKFCLHYGMPGQGLQTSAVKVLDTTEWHNYAVDWSPAGVKGYIDGVLWFSDTSPDRNPDQPMHQAIQLDFFPNGSTPGQAWMQVDWTRAYK